MSIQLRWGWRGTIAGLIYKLADKITPPEMRTYFNRIIKTAWTTHHIGRIQGENQMTVLPLNKLKEHAKSMQQALSMETTPTHKDEITLIWGKNVATPETVLQLIARIEAALPHNREHLAENNYTQPRQIRVEVSNAPHRYFDALHQEINHQLEPCGTIDALKSRVQELEATSNEVRSLADLWEAQAQSAQREIDTYPWGEQQVQILKFVAEKNALHAKELREALGDTEHASDSAASA